DRFGTSVALFDNIVVGGAPFRNGGRGVVQVQIEDVSGGILNAVALVPSDVDSGDRFGNCLATNGTMLVVGSPFHNNERGAAYIYDLRSGDFMTKYSAQVAAVGEAYGYSVALHGRRLLVGVPGANSGRGRVEW